MRMSNSNDSTKMPTVHVIETETPGKMITALNLCDCRIMIERKRRCINDKLSATVVEYERTGKITVPIYVVVRPRGIEIPRTCWWVTRIGQACAHRVKEGETYCFQHKKQSDHRMVVNVEREINETEGKTKEFKTQRRQRSRKIPNEMEVKIKEFFQKRRMEKERLEREARFSQMIELCRGLEGVFSA